MSAAAPLLIRNFSTSVESDAEAIIKANTIEAKRRSFNTMTENLYNKKRDVAQSRQNCSIWIVLTRHIMDRDDFANNKEYIALLVYKNNGEKVYYPCKLSYFFVIF